MVGPDYKDPATQIASQWNTDHNGVKTASSEEMEQQDANWWKSFNDPVLNNLIELGYQNNPSLQISGVSILKSRAVLGESVGMLYPQEQAVSGNYTREDMGSGSQFDGVIPQDIETASVSLGASWEIDFWGKYRRAIRSSNASFLASIAAYNDSLVTLTAEIGSSYVAIRTYQAQIAVTNKSILAQKESLAIAQAQYAAGKTSLSDVQQAITALNQTEASLPELKISLQQQKDALALLVGTTPDKIDDLIKPNNNQKTQIPTAPRNIAVGIPKDVLRQRPDVMEAQLESIAQSEGIGAVKAQLYPAFSLSGSFGYSSSNIGDSSTADLFQWSNHTVSIGPSVYIPLFNYGQITNQVREQDAAFQESILNYQNVVLNAQKEVQDGIVSYVESQHTMQSMDKANKAALTTLELTIVRYRNGEVDYSAVLNALKDQLNVELSYIDAQGSVPQGLISLYRALGGGWQIRNGQDVVSEKTKQQMAKRTNWGNLLEEKSHSAPQNNSEQRDQTLYPSW